MQPSEPSVYAIIQSGGKQYRVAQGDIIEVELLDAEPGQKVEFAGPEVLFVSDGTTAAIGSPGVAGYSVIGELMAVVPGPKVVSMKYKPSHHQYKRWGHRQHYSQVRITEIAKG